MHYYLLFDATGAVYGRASRSQPIETLPAGEIECTADQYAHHTDFRVQGGAVAAIPSAEVAARAAAATLTAAQKSIRAMAFARMEALYQFTDSNGVVWNRQESVTRYGIQLNAMVTGGQTLADDQKADAQTLLAAAATEQAILDEAARLLAQASTDATGALATAADGSTWPAPPAALAALVAAC